MSVGRSQEGQTLPLVALIVVTLMVAAALSVDIGSLALTNRRLQGMADLAAIDGARELTGAACNAPIDTSPGALIQHDHVRQAVLKSLERNGFVIGGSKTMVFELGRIVPPAGDGVPGFTPLPGCTVTDYPDSLRVRVGDRTMYGFAKVIGQDGRTSSRAGVGSRPGIGTTEGHGTFSVGSSLASINTSESALFNAILGDMLCVSGTCAVSLNAVSYQGLVASKLTYGALATQMGFGSTSALFSSSVTFDEVALAAANLVGPTTTAGIDLLGLRTASTVTGSIKLGDMVNAAMTTGNSAADLEFNLFELVTGTAALANGTNFVTIPSTAVTIPGVTSTRLEVSLIEVPVNVGDDVGDTGSTKQLSIKVTPTLALSSQVLAGLNLATVTGTLPITISGGAATGTLTDVQCGPGKGLEATVTANAATITTGATLNLSLTTGANTDILSGLISGILGSGTISTSVTANGSVTTATSTDVLTFSHPDGFGPTGIQTVGNTTLGLDDIGYLAGTLNMSVPRVSVLGIPLLNANVSLAVTPAALASMLSPLMQVIDTQILQPLIELFGLKIGAADVMATSLSCGVPRIG